MSKTIQNFLASNLAEVDIKLGGDRPWDVRVHDSRTYGRIVRQGSLGLGESFMDGWWECDQLGEMLTRALTLPALEALAHRGTLKMRLVRLLTNPQTIRKSKKEVGRTHYVHRNRFYQLMLDPLMLYTCGYWDEKIGASDLDSAQRAKLDLVAVKLGLKPGMKVLDIGCGWGGAAYHLARNYGVEVTGLTLSESQLEMAEERCSGVSASFEMCDYRLHQKRYDRVYSIGMFEHVGDKNHRTYMKKVQQLLEPEGLSLLQSIGQNPGLPFNDPWIDKYIFPGSLIPSCIDISTALDGVLIMEDWQNFGLHYVPTLDGWAENLRRNEEEILSSLCDKRELRMWHFYLASSAAYFRARQLQLFQVLMSLPGVRSTPLPRFRKDLDDVKLPPVAKKPPVKVREDDAPEKGRKKQAVAG